MNPRDRWRWWWVLALGPVVQMWVWARAELTSVSAVNDVAFHKSIIEFFTQRLRTGNYSLDGWTPNFSLGYPVAHHYQTLPHRIGAVLAMLTGTDRPAQWLTVILLCCWPVSVMVGLRWMGVGRIASLSTAALVPLISSQSGATGDNTTLTGYGYEIGSYLWRGNGLWAQLFGMVLLPLALGLAWRRIDQGKSRRSAPVALAGLVAVHFITAYVIAAAIVLMAAIAPLQVRRFGRAAVLGGLGVVLSMWVIVPIALDDHVTARSIYNVTQCYWSQSFGLQETGKQLLTGQVFDHGSQPGRWMPVLSILVGVGVLTSLVRWRDRLCRFALAFMVIAMGLFAGTATFGFLKWLPGGTGLLFHRFVLAVHIAGIVLIGIGLEGVVRLTDRLIARVPGAALRWRLSGLLMVLVVAGLCSYGGAYEERRTYVRLNEQLIARQLGAEHEAIPSLRELLAQIEPGEGRTFAGYYASPQSLHIGEASMAIVIAQRQIDQVGFALRTTSLMSDIEPRFNGAEQRFYEMFGVRFLIIDARLKPAIPATLVATSGPYSLYEIATAGYVSVMDLIGPALPFDRSEMTAAADTYFRTDGPAQGYTQPLAASFATIPSDLPTQSAGKPGAVIAEDNDPAAGIFRATVEMDRPGVAVATSSFHTRIHATVDGSDAEVFPVAPAFNAVQVPAGQHVVEFRYEPTRLPEWLLLVALLVFLAYCVVVRRSSSSDVIEIETSRPNAADDVGEHLNRGGPIDRLVVAPLNHPPVMPENE